MYVGIPNPNAIIPLEKMIIVNTDTNDEFTVLYNPQSYRREHQTELSEKNVQGGDAKLMQFTNGGEEMLSFDLFFDSASASTEVGGLMNKLKYGANSLLPSIANAIDVRKEANKIYNLMNIDKTVHRPPLVNVMWQKLDFTGFLIKCVQNFTKFNERGMAVRATLQCTFMEVVPPEKLFGSEPNESPDTTKYRRVNEGDSLWALASAEYGDSGKWRVIAGANGIANPRLLHAGDMIRVPALRD